MGAVPTLYQGVDAMGSAVYAAGGARAVHLNLVGARAALAVGNWYQANRCLEAVWPCLADYNDWDAADDVAHAGNVCLELLSGATEGGDLDWALEVAEWDGAPSLGAHLAACLEEAEGDAGYDAAALE